METDNAMVACWPEWVPVLGAWRRVLWTVKIGPRGHRAYVSLADHDDYVTYVICA